MNTLEDNLGREKNNKRGRKRLSQDEIEKIIISHETYNGNAMRASTQLPHSPRTIIKYWREEGLEIQKRGIKRGILLNKEKYELIKKLIDDGYRQSEIARELKVVRQNINQYLKLHPELPKPQKQSSKGTIRDPEKYGKIKELLEEGNSLSKIAELLKYSNYNGVATYIKTHLELREIYDGKREERRNKK